MFHVLMRKVDNRGSKVLIDVTGFRVGDRGSTEKICPNLLPAKLINLTRVVGLWDRTVFQTV